eukprot:scaffold7710_cov376-Prasinococcus_capsulatus_cf.AAC.2
MGDSGGFGSDRQGAETVMLACRAQTTHCHTKRVQWGPIPSHCLPAPTFHVLRPAAPRVCTRTRWVHEVVLGSACPPHRLPARRLPELSHMRAGECRLLIAQLSEEDSMGHCYRWDSLYCQTEDLVGRWGRWVPPSEVPGDQAGTLTCCDGKSRTETFRRLSHPRCAP